MMIIIAVIVVILLTVGIVWAIDKFIPSKLKAPISILLWIGIFALGYLTFNSVYDEIKFHNIKQDRYAAVIKNLVDIRDSELAYKEVNGEFTGNYNELIKFIETGKFAIIERRDSTVLDEEKTKAYGGIKYTKEITITDTLDFVSVRDSLFKKSNRYKTMMNIPFTKEGTTFALKAGITGEKGKELPVFEAVAWKKDILFDQPKDLIKKEENAFSVEEINGDAIKIGSMDEVKVNGNWPKVYDPIKD
ncbi:hypothetical protein [Lacinutrix sp. Bg11-31]|uniref:hypothetical protein n=1 Tax=Lacinutrix sp. Bg11-31 TaxID=2057808 RepID=UPI000C30091D|nr:hypothetical protein [Lacinutrix sp. Bg11-31]AUC81612.1 hypothetical protein CW733_05480 [Lacinutrix sp. Bg11-31]